MGWRRVPGKVRPARYSLSTLNEGDGEMTATTETGFDGQSQDADGQEPTQSEQSSLEQATPAEPELTSGQTNGSGTMQPHDGQPSSHIKTAPPVN